MEQPQIKLSVALVTRNRPGSLERTLKSLRAQAIQPWEVIVSDDSDDIHTNEVAALAECYGCRYLCGLRRGLYANRNYAALACRGTHIRTMDDDHEFPPGHMEKCLAAIKDDPASVWSIGEDYPETQTERRPPASPGQLHPRGFSVVSLDAQRCWAISDGASIYPREIFESGLLYIEDYTFGAAYLEFGSRLYWLGYRLRHLSETYVIHHYDPTTRSFLDVNVDLSSRFCAMLCHAYIYQPKPANKILCRMEMLKQILLHRQIAFKAISAGTRSYHKQRDLLRLNRCQFQRSANIATCPGRPY